MAVGALPVEIITAFQFVLDESLNEEAVLNKRNDVAHHVRRLREDVENIPSIGMSFAMVIMLHIC